MTATNGQKGSGKRVIPRVAAAVMTVLLLLSAVEALAWPDSNSVLVLYDSGGAYAHVGHASAIMLQNLLGHFRMDVTLKAASEYQLGEMRSKRAVFYLGTTFDELSYHAEGSDDYKRYKDFLNDTLSTESTIIWMNYNIWLLAEALAENGGNFADRYGFTHYSVMNNGYNRVHYKGRVLNKGVVAFANVGANLVGCTAEGDNAYACATEINRVSIRDEDRVAVHAHTYSTLDPAAEAAPYVIHADNFWFVADMPFSYFSEEDRYLAFADLLHDILGSKVTETHLALVRLEDVSAASDLSALREVTDYLVSAKIPFSVATIPFHYDGERWSRLSGSAVGRHLRGLSSYRYDRRTPAASIVAHGKTHQSAYDANPYDGVSGSDFEFYRVTLNDDNSLNFVSPLPGDSEAWAYSRMWDATWEFIRSGIGAFAWEAPHYMASSADYRGVRNLYPVHYGRMTYFTGDDDQDMIWPVFFPWFDFWNRRPQPVTSLNMLGQFFPYAIYKDHYGYQLVPENMGYYQPDPIEGYRPLYTEDLIRHAEKLLVVRDGYASFFYHPDLGAAALREIIEGVQALGYRFVSGESVFREVGFPFY